MMLYTVIKLPTEMIILTFTVYSDERETTRIAFAPVFQNKKFETYA